MTFKVIRFHKYGWISTPIYLFLIVHLQSQLTDYMKAYSIVKIVRMPERVGLIRARLAGLPHSTAEVVTYLDSHCEATNGKCLSQKDS